MKTEKLYSLLETHFEIVRAIIKMEDIEGSKSYCIRKEKGIGGLYELAQELTTDFEKIHSKTVWGIEKEFFETLEDFLEDKI